LRRRVKGRGIEKGSVGGRGVERRPGKLKVEGKGGRERDGRGRWRD